MTKWSFLLLVVSSCFVSACAGSTKFTGCEPAVCGADCTPGQPCLNGLSLSAGGMGTVKATLSVEGSHAGKFTVTVEGNDTVTATVSPTTLDMADGDTADITVTLAVAATATKGSHSIYLTAANEDGISAGTNISVDVP